ncbi:MAG: hypothetical protein REI11_10660, partial [Patulibacter sp.]|nr:hypothetical protein [Patulibacter sp.]
MATTRIKFCGITRLEDAIAAADAGAWAIGFILWPGSARAIAPEEAALIARQLRRRVRIAGVFVDQGMDEVVRLTEQIGLDLVQLHGNEGPAYASEIHRRTGAQIIKAARVSNLGDVNALQSYRIDVDFHLLDSYVEGEMGGTGVPFDHELARAHKRRIALILSGGLNADTVGHAIRQVAPFAVDVSSGVEVSPGIKDPALIEAFAAAVAAATPETADPEEVESGYESVRGTAPDERGDRPAGGADEAMDAHGVLMSQSDEEVAQMRDEDTQPQSGEEPLTTPEGAQDELTSTGETSSEISDTPAAPVDGTGSEGDDTPEETLFEDAAVEAQLDDQDPLEDSEDEDDAFDPTDELEIAGAEEDDDDWVEVTSADEPAPFKPRGRGQGYRGPSSPVDEDDDPSDGPARGGRGGGFRDREDRGPRGGGGFREDRGPRGGGGFRDRDDRGPRGGGGGFRDRDDRGPRGGGGFQ